MGSKGDTTSTTNQTQTYTPAGLGYMQDALNAGQQVAQLPFNLPQAPVAGFNPQQQQAFGQFGQAANAAQPYYDQANSYFSPQGASQFFNPQAQAVMAQMQNIFGQQNLQNTANLTQAAGGVGADRIAVGQANMANQQGLAAGQTLAQLWQQAQQAAQGTGQGQMALGQNAQNSMLQGAQGLYGSGLYQQQQQQAQMNAPYQYQLAQAAFPYQQAQWLASLTGALAPQMGGTTQGTGTTTSQYNPSLAGQIGGGALALGSMFLNRGGAINPFARGGGVPAGDEPIDISGGYIKPGNLSAGQAAHGANLNLSGGKDMTPKGLDFGALGKMAGSLFGPAWGGGTAFGGDAYGGSGSNPLPGLTAADYGPGFDDGGAVPGGGFGSMLQGMPQGGGMFGSMPGMGGSGFQLGALQGQQPQQQGSSPFGNMSGGKGAIWQNWLNAMGQKGSHGGHGGFQLGALQGHADGGAVDDGDVPDFVDRWNELSPNAGDPIREPDQAAVNAWRQGADADVADALPLADATPASMTRSTAPAAIAAAGAPTGSMSGPAPTDAGAPAPDGGASGKGGGLRGLVEGYTKDPLKMAMLMAGLNAMRTGSLAEGVGAGTKFLQGAHESEQQDQKLQQQAQAQQFEQTQMTPYQQAQIDVANKKLEKDSGDTTVKDIVDGMERGDIPPTTTGLYGKGAAVRAEASRRGLNLTKAQMEYASAQKQISVLNGPQTMRLVGLAKSVDNTIDEVTALAEQLHNSGVPILNRAKLAAIMQTEGNTPRGQLATRYLTAVNTVKEEFANAANGGYAPTEPAWQLANQQINGDYGEQQLKASLGEVQRLIRYRINAIPNIGTLGPGAANRYTGAAGAGTAPQQGPSAKPPVVYQNGHQYNLQPDGSYQ